MRRAALLAVLLAASAAVAQPTAEAERLYTEGQQAYDAKDYDKALAAWQKSYQLSKLPALVFNIAQAHRLRGDCAKAVASYKQFIQLDPTSSERPDAEGFIKDLEPCPASVTPDKPPADPVKPAPTITKPVTRDDHPGRTKKLAAVGIGVAGVALVATGLVYGKKASSAADDIDADCADGCLWDDIRDLDADGRSAERNQYIFVGAGVAALAGAGIMYWLGSREGNRTSTMAIIPRTDGAAISWSRRF